MKSWRTNLRLILAICVVVLLPQAASADDASLLLAGGLGAPLYALQPDTTTNKTLDDMLAQFLSDPESTELAYDSWTLTAHRYLGWAMVAGTAAQVVLGSITWDERKQGKQPSTLDAHKYLGYSLAGVALVNTSLGYYNLWKMRDRETGKKKRWTHFTLSTLAAAGYVTAAALSYNARKDLEEGKALDKTFDDLYGDHRTVAILTTASVLFTVTVIVW